MGNKKGSKEGKLIRYMKAPIRLLSKARDFYVNGMNDCSSHFAYVDIFLGCPAVQPPTGLHRSFSVGSASSSSAADDYRELVRAASVGSGTNRKQVAPSPTPPAKKTAVSRSRSVGIGRIDEDKPCDFKDDIKAKACVYGRSKSYICRS